MSEFGKGWWVLVLGVAAILLGLPAPASAHETKKIDRLHLTIGWGDEPAFTGSRNSVEVSLSDASGAPVSDPGASLSAEVSFGDRRIVLPLQPDGGRPGRFRAWLVPTRPGTYTFHITGSVKGQTIDATSTCSESTFDCVRNDSELQFPEKEPTAAQVAEAAGRALTRGDEALSTGTGARRMALVALALAGLALAAAIGLGARKGRKGD